MSLAHLGAALKSLSEIAALVKAIEGLFGHPVTAESIGALASAVADLVAKLAGKALPPIVKTAITAVPELFVLVTAIEDIAQKHKAGEPITAEDVTSISKAVESLFERVAGFALPTSA